MSGFCSKHATFIFVSGLYSMLLFNRFLTTAQKADVKNAIARHPYSLFMLWLAAFYAVWLYIIIKNDLWQIVISHWPISAAMAAGSYFAGSTPMGGGTVGFPILVLLFDMPASLGRNFGLAIQSIGMTSASLYILASRKKLDWALLRPAMLGALFATPLSAGFVAPHTPDLWVKLLFATIWASFGVIHFVKLNAILASEPARIPDAEQDRPIGLIIGVVGGVVSALTGVGIDMMIYAALVLFYRSDVKVAIPTSVVLMAFTSVIGLTSNLFLTGVNPEQYVITPEMFYNWLAAAPIVIIGAPFGALVVNRLSRQPTLLIVSALCIGQFVWMLIHEKVTGLPLLSALVGLLALNLFFLRLFQVGERRRQKSISFE
ncbi:MAG: sulfite exporter TauE/SafE family protein [Pseudomonadota bacterium]